MEGGGRRWSVNRKQQEAERQRLVCSFLSVTLDQTDADGRAGRNAYLNSTHIPLHFQRFGPDLVDLLHALAEYLQ